MVEVRYISGSNNMFELCYDLHNYISDDFFYEFPQHTEIHFLEKLFKQDSNFFFCGKVPLIWSTDYNWKVNGMPFTISLDEDYDLIIFTVQNPDHRKVVADYIGNSINTKHIL